MRFILLSTLALCATVPLIHGAQHDPLETVTVPPPGKKLRGNRVEAVHKRVMHPHTTEEARKEGNVVLDPLVSPHKSVEEQAQKIKLRGATREITVDMDKLEPHVSHKHNLLHQHKHHDSLDYHEYDHVRHGNHHNGDSEIKDTQTPLTKSTSEAQEGHHHHHGHHNQIHYYHHQTKPTIKSLFALPTARNEFFNETLFDLLHNAPFEIYEDAMGHKLEADDSFPVFTVPTWYNTTGVFSAFSKTATPLIFESSQILLDWQNIMAASNGASPALNEFIADSNFHASLIVGKSFGQAGVTSFLGLIVSYYQFGVEKNVLIPFAKIGDFFEDSSEYQISDPSTRNLEMSALNELLTHSKANSTNTHPILELRDARMEELENLDAIRFQKLFQALIRRSFLFAFGYADCIRYNPYELRECLDDTFSNVVKLETSVRGALDKELAEQFGQINESFHSRVSEACIMAQGDSAFGSGSCYDFNDLRSFFHSTVQ